MTAATNVVIYDDRTLWHLAPDTTFREIGKHGRTFVVGSTPGRVWVGAIPCDIDSVEMPVEVIA
jgi:hypothetical protein